MKLITMTHNNRPKYSRRVLDALKCCRGIEDYAVLAFVEPGCEEVISIVRSMSFTNIHVVINPKVLDCPRNTLQALTRGFEDTDFLIHIEDDCVPAPDVLEFFEYCRVRYKDDLAIFSVCAHNRENIINKKYHGVDNIIDLKIERKPLEEEHYQLFRENWFTPWCWATWTDRWDGIKDGFDFSRGGWGLNLNDFLRGDRFEIRPRLARCQNIGRRGGRYCPDPKFHSINQWNKYWSGAIDLPPGKFWETEDESQNIS